MEKDKMVLELTDKAGMQQVNGIRIGKELHNAGQSWQEGMKNIFCKTRR